MEALNLVLTSAFANNRLTVPERHLKDQVAAWTAAHAGEFLEDLAAWIAVPSVSRPELAAPGAPFGPDVNIMLATAGATAARYGLGVEFHDGYAVSVLGPEVPAAAGPSLGDIALVCHLDVVPAGDGWAQDPFTLRRVGDVLVGRGVFDNKGAALTALYVLRAAADLKLPLRHRLRLVLGGSEETAGMPDIRYYAAHAPLPRVSLVADGPFGANYAQQGMAMVDVDLPVGERLATLAAGGAPNAIPGLAQVVLPARPGLAGLADWADFLGHAIQAAAGRLGFDPAWFAAVPADAPSPGGVLVTVEGVAGHSSLPANARNPIPGLAAVLLEAGLLDDPTDIATAQVLATMLSPDGSGIGMGEPVEGNLPLTMNGVIWPRDPGKPDQAGWTGRAPLEGEPPYLRMRIDFRYPKHLTGPQLAEAVAAAIKPAGGQVVGLEDEPGFDSGRDGRLVRTLQQAFNDLVGVDYEPFAMGGGTHARLLPRAVSFGPDFWYLPEAAATVAGATSAPGAAPGAGGAHAVDEAVPYNHLLAAQQIYAVALTRLDTVLAATPPGGELEP
ncbi:MAG: M20/M25/M40 family metallo-hydrolase [Bifidobacteriaceae bacterium]|jgi:succinyl-diaminopimelate desuccinylase|nr:M20/M25/M40 family metallo-hydrolase [Bifidobacteriaceae bacterium]